MAAGRHGVYRGNQFRSCESEVKFIGRRSSYHAGGGGEGLGGDRKRRSRIEIDRSKERPVSRRKEVVIDGGHRLASNNSNIDRGFDVKTRVFTRIVDQERFDLGSQVENNEGLKSEGKVPSPPIKKRKFSPILWDKDENKVSNSSKIDMATERFKLPVFKSTIQSENVIQDSFSVDQFDVLDRSIVTESQVVVVDSSSPQGQIRSSCHEQGELEEEEEEVIVPRNISVTRWAETSCSTRRDNEEIPEPGEIIREGMQAKSTGGKRSDGSVSKGENSDHMLVSNDSVDIDDKNMNDNVNVNVSDRDSKGKSKKNNCPGKNINMLLGCRSVHEFEKLNRINEGTYGVVYRARNKKTKEIVALKKVKMEKETEGFPITSLREINILLCSNHPSIVDLKEVVMDDFDGIFMVMEYMEHDLKGLMDTMKQPFSQSEVKCLMFQLLSAVKYLHDNGVLHRDLKTSNILFNNRGELKICDFGLSRQYGSPLTHMVVTLWYRAPELLLGERKYSTAIDMWSLGCIMAELLAKEPLFNGKTEFDQLDKIFRTLGTPSETIWPGFSKLPGLKGNFAKHQYNQLRKKFPATSFIGSPILSHAGFDLLNRLLTYDPEKRISAEDALNHEWFSEVPLPKSKDFMPTFPPQHAQDSRLTRVTRSPDPLEEQRRRELLQQGTGGIFG